MNGLDGNCGCREQSSDGSTTRTGDLSEAVGDDGGAISEDDASNDGGVRGLSGGDGAGAGAGDGAGLSEAVGAGLTTVTVFGFSTVIVFINCFLKFVCWLDTSIVIVVVPTLFAVNSALFVSLDATDGCELPVIVYV